MTEKPKDPKETALTATAQSDAQMLENVLLQGDLSKLTPAQRVSYYKKVCDSLGLNPLTRPFDYITLNNRLTLYAKKDATDQLRTLHGVSIDDVEINETTTQFIVKAKGHNREGRTDVEVGVVSKEDMHGNLANAQMKAVTKAKRRLTLSLCGLGWLDETETATILDAQESSADSNNETPIEKGIRLYAELCQRAEAAGVSYEPLPEPVTIEQCRALYKDLQEFVEAAEAQAEDNK